MANYIPVELRAAVETADQGICRYCQTSEANSGLSMTFDHIVPRSAGGEDRFKNLCLACRRCNESKSDRQDVVDPVSGQKVRLFNPRRQLWSEHFAWATGASRIEGLTAIGRATVIALKMNDWVIVKARERWALSGWHPPDNAPSANSAESP